MARIAVAVLTNPDGHASKSYRITGPKLLSAYDIVEFIRRVLGHAVFPVTMPLWMLVKAARLQGETAYTISQLRHYIEDHKQGAFEYGAPDDVVLELIVQPAEEMEATVRRYLAMPFARKTLANRMRAFRDFNIIPFVPVYKLDQYDREHLQSVPPNAVYVMATPQWKAEQHGSLGSDSCARPRIVEGRIMNASNSSTPYDTFVNVAAIAWQCQSQ